MAPTQKKPERFSKRLAKLAEIETLTKSATKLVPDVITGNNSHVIMKRCPICGVIFDSIESRQNHEKLLHFLPDQRPIQKSINNSITEQRKFLMHFNLVQNSSIRPWSVMDALASRPYVLQSLRAEGAGNAIGHYKCHHCKYETTRTFILWAHVTTCHTEVVYDKRSGPYCFLCNRYLSKCNSFIKHYKKCCKTPESVKTNSVVEPAVKRFTCDMCNDSWDSVSDPEKHFCSHVIAGTVKDNNNNNI